MASFEVLIVGCGNIAGGFDMSRDPSLPPLSHAGAFTQHSGFRVSACVDPDQEKQASFAKHWSVDMHAASIDDLSVDSGEFDVISICSPTELHHEHIQQALALQPQVIFCEKPLTSNEGSATRLNEICQSKGVTLIVNYSRRWDPSVSDLEMQLNGGRWGRIRSVVGHYNKGILNNGGHMIDLLRRLLGPLNIVTTFHAEHDYWESDPTVAVLLSAEDGAMPVYLNPSNAQDFAFFELEIICELGVIRMLSGGLAWQFREAEQSSLFTGYRTLGLETQYNGRYMEAMAGAVEEIYQHLTNGSLVDSTGENAIQVQSLCMQIQREAFEKKMPSKCN